MKDLSNRKWGAAPILFLLLLSYAWAAETEKGLPAKTSPTGKVDESTLVQKPPSIVGQKISSQWKMENDEGKQVALPNLMTDKTAVLIFFLSAHDPVTLAYAERIRKIAEDPKNKPLLVMGLSVNQDETLQELKAVADQSDWTFPIYKDVGQNIAVGLKIQTTPQAVLVNSEGVVWYRGAIDDCWLDARKVKDPALRQAIDALLSGKKVTNPEPGYFLGRAIK